MNESESPWCKLKPSPIHIFNTVTQMWHPFGILQGTDVENLHWCLLSGYRTRYNGVEVQLTHGKVEPIQPVAPYVPYV